MIYKIFFGLSKEEVEKKIDDFVDHTDRVFKPIELIKTAGCRSYDYNGFSIRVWTDVSGVTRYDSATEITL